MRTCVDVEGGNPLGQAKVEKARLDLEDAEVDVRPLRERYERHDRGLEGVVEREGQLEGEYE